MLSYLQNRDRMPAIKTILHTAKYHKFNLMAWIFLV